MRFYASNALWKWQLSNPDVVATAGVDTEQAREAAKAADLIIEHYENLFFQPQVTIKEGLQGLCWGTYIWRVRYDDTKHSITALQPVYGDQQVTLGPGYGQCAECGATGTAADFPPDETGTPTCPQCGGTAQVENATDNVPGIVGQQEVQLGDLTCELLPFPECRWDLNYRAEDSSWFIHQRRTSATAIRRLLGNVVIPGVDRKAPGLDIWEKLAWAGQSGGGRSFTDFVKSKLYKQPVTIVEFSVGPDDIADIILEAPEQTLSGQTIPAGPLIQTFPKGLTVQGINDLNVITGIWDVHHSAEIVQGVWHSRVSSGAGQGFGDLAEVQKRFIADDSQVHTFLRAVGSPGMLYRQEVLGDMDRAEYLGDPEINIAINGRDLPDGMRLGDVVAPAWQPQSVPGQLFNYTYDRLNDFAQLTSHITDFAGGLPNVNNKTATGAQISQANSNALFTPPLQIKGEVRRKIAKIVLELYRTHFPVDRPFALKGKHGRLQYVYLNGAKLDTDIALQVTKDSEAPRNKFTKREDYNAFFMMMGGAAGYAQISQMFPELTADIESQFNIDLATNTYDHVASLCQQRIQQMQEAEQFVAPMMQAGMMGGGGAPPGPPGQQPPQQPQSPDQSGQQSPMDISSAPPQPGDQQLMPQQPQQPPQQPMQQPGAPQQGMQPPQQLPPQAAQLLLQAIQPPPTLEEPDHDKKAKYLSEWLDYDAGQQAGPALRQAVIMLIQTHFQMMVMMAQLMQQAMPAPPDQGGGGGDGGGGGNGGGGKQPPKKKEDPTQTKPNTDPGRPISGRPA
jgi:hypothetical protein